VTEREYPARPITGIGVVIWRGDRVLLVRRGHEPRKGQWALPGGAQKLGETLFQAAIREVLEETGISIDPLRVITAIDLIEPGEEGPRYHYTLVEIAARYLAGEAIAGSDAEAAGWYLPEEIPALNAWEKVAEVVALSQDQMAPSER
jgi:ADP-ribose pyrophosphatase YjhB (NUDIX family)